MSQSENPPWAPVLQGRDALRAEKAILRVARDLPAPGAFSGDSSLANGAAGLALGFTHLERWRPGEGFGERAEAYLELALDALTSRPLPPAFFGGISGVAWTLEHLRAQGGLEWGGEGGMDANDPCVQIDSAIAASLENRHGAWDFDLVRGIAGVGFYALGRMRTASGRRLLEAALAALERASVTSAEGVAWFTPPEMLPDWQRAGHPKGHFDLGMAHGIPGVITFLAATAREAFQLERVVPLLDGAVGWMLANRAPGNEGFTFSNFLTRQESLEERLERERHKTRIAWCYGDLGSGLSLLAAARARGRDEWEREALDVLRLAAMRPMALSEVRDAGLCHGAAGNAHLYSRLFQAVGDPLFLQAAQANFAWALDFQDPEAGLGGFRVRRSNDSGATPWEAVPGLLEGSMGVALAFLGGISGLDPGWDGFMIGPWPLP